MLIDNEEGLQVVAEAGAVPDAERVIRAHRPTARCSTSTCRAAPARGDPAPARVGAGDGDRRADDAGRPGFARQALQAGALGFVLKEAADEELLEAISSAARGDTYPTALGCADGGRASRSPRARRTT